MPEEPAAAPDPSDATRQIDPAVIALTRALSRQLARRGPDGETHFDMPALVRAVRDADTQPDRAAAPPDHSPGSQGVLPVGVTTASSTPLDGRRNRIAGRLANAALRLATSEYRAFVGGSIRYGLHAAIQDTQHAASQARTEPTTTSHGAPHA